MIGALHLPSDINTKMLLVPEPATAQQFPSASQGYLSVPAQANQAVARLQASLGEHLR